MTAPPGFEDEFGTQVCILKKALYGLKQYPRAWFGRFTKVMLGMKYKQSQGDHTLFTKFSTGSKMAALIVYVGDIIVRGNDTEEMNQLKLKLAQEFEIKDLGKLKYFLSIEVARSKAGIFLSQRKHILDSLKETGMMGCKPIHTPIESNHKLSEAKDDEPVDKGRYQRLVGRLIYLSHTWPYIAYTVSIISQFMHNPKSVHLQAISRVLSYLKTTPGRGIMLSKNESRTIEAYTDADWAGSVTDRKSTTGYCIMFFGNLITWRSKKQSVVARSSAEAKFRAMAHGIWTTAIAAVPAEEGDGRVVIAQNNFGQRAVAQKRSGRRHPSTSPRSSAGAASPSLVVAIGNEGVGLGVAGATGLGGGGGAVGNELVGEGGGGVLGV
ncbi:UNVERIFIED_CONTAM: Retrovirus-related Pol polyprotein from transposon RE1 [Sesamum radiatum]|uniref:Retrovirus-related Pol polyprotein from transposon RE1 n=1 Tax=Sesamum radiatum TaxID=300843 RepID=A0AAW2KBT0_SESRA